MARSNGALIVAWSSSEDTPFLLPRYVTRYLILLIEACYLINVIFFVSVLFPAFIR